MVQGKLCVNYVLVVKVVELSMLSFNFVIFFRFKLFVIVVSFLK